MGEPWLPSRLTPDPQSGYDLAVKLARMAVKVTQPDAATREAIRAVYERDASALIQGSGVVAIHFQTIAAANSYWRGDP